MINKIKCNVCVLLAAAVCFALGACSGEEGDSMPQVPANPDALCALTPNAVEICPVDASATPLTRSATGESEQKATYAENLGRNFSAEATLEAVPQEAQTRAGANLAADAQYRIVVYDGSGAIVGNVVYKQGSTDVVSGDAIKLKAGTYRLFAYTFNSASAIRGLDADNKNVTVNNGEDFMTYTNTAFTISATDYGSGKALDISFTRQCARLTVRIIVEGYDDNTVTDATMDISNVFGSSKWDGTTNTDASTLPTVAGKGILTKASGDASTVDCGSSADNPYLITQPFTDQYLRVVELSLTVGIVRKKIYNINLPSSITFVKGGSYRLTIHTGNYYVLTSSNPVSMGGVKWARTNLQQTGSGDSAPVSFVANPWDYGSLWIWGMRDATRRGEFDVLLADIWSNSADGDTHQDPCRALPGSNWRVPTEDYMKRLLNYQVPKGTKVRINGTINTIGDYGWAPDAKGIVCRNLNSVIFLPAAGRDDYYNGFIVGSGLYHANTSAVGNYGYRFSSVLEFNSTKSEFNICSLIQSVGCSMRCVQDF